MPRTGSGENPMLRREAALCMEVQSCWIASPSYGAACMEFQRPIASLPACWDTMFSSDGTRAYESTCIEVRPRQYNAHLGVVGLSDGVRRVRFYACTIVAMRLAFAGRYRMVRMDTDAS